MVKVLVADDFPIVREGIINALERHPEITVVAQAGDGLETIEAAHQAHPDVILLDLRMPRLSGLMALTRLREELPQTRVIILSVSETPDSVIDAAAAGADGYLSKATGGDELCHAVLTVQAGHAIISPHLTRHLMRNCRARGEHDNNTSREGETTLQTRELNVLRLLASGHTDKQISQTLYMSTRTVQNHLARIRTKTGRQRRAELARWATERGVV
jgi:DNA-binding NarL/FixJ family response regulator